MYSDLRRSHPCWECGMHRIGLGRVAAFRGGPTRAGSVQCWERGRIATMRERGFSRLGRAGRARAAEAGDQGFNGGVKNVEVALPPRFHRSACRPGVVGWVVSRCIGRLGLVVSSGGGYRSGEPNAWQLTPPGWKVAQRLRIGVAASTCWRALRVLLAVLVVLVLPAAARAASCPNEQIRKTEVYALALPDCRAYEQASPVDKNDTDAQGTVQLAESSPSGERVAYFSQLPFPGLEGSGAFGTTYLSSFAGGEWSTQGLLPPSNAAANSGVEALSEDLNYAVVYVSTAGPLLGQAPSIRGEEGALESASLEHGNYYIRDNLTGEYRLLAPGDGVEEFFDDVSHDDATILFEDRTKLTENAVSLQFPEPSEEKFKGSNVYEWKDGVVTVAGLVPPPGDPSCGPSGPACKAPADGTVAGPGGDAFTESEQGVLGRELPGGATSGGPSIELQNTLSQDGSRVFFTEVETGQIYMREPATKRTIAVSSGNEPAYWRAATPSGSYAFYSEGKGANRNLYRFAAEGERSEALTSGEAHVLGTLGVSDDGSYAYFVAEGVLAANENGENKVAESGQPNLYEWHNGKVSFIAQFEGGRSEENTNWTDFNITSGADEGQKSSRVTPAGTTVLFSSFNKITSYDNNGMDELYRYDGTRPLSLENPACVSCNPNNSPAGAETFLARHIAAFSLAPRNGYLTNNLSLNGNRVFFQTTEKLASGDVNGQMNVYEWEREGEGGCGAGEGGPSGGCIYLISSGASPQESYFGDAGANGEDVFFFTRQSLVTQDRDENMDVYDARVDGGLESQAQPPSAGECEGEWCRGSSPSAPAFGTPSSVTLSGSGNLAPPLESKVVKSKLKPMTRAQKLAAALRACNKKSKRERAICRARAQTRYGTKAKKSDRGAK
jgi:hypothetical protein